MKSATKTGASDAPIQRKISRRIDLLANDPRPFGVAKLTDVSPPIFRVREGQYRILYTIEDDRLIVLVVKIGHRSDAYRNIGTSDGCHP